MTENQFDHADVKIEPFILLLIHVFALFFLRWFVPLPFQSTLASFAFGTYWGLILSPLFVVLMNTLVVQYEEVYLEKKFKDVYINYKSRVMRWL